MTAPTDLWASSRRWSVMVGSGLSVLVLVVVAVDPRLGGLLLIAGAFAAVVVVVALRNPALAVLLTLVCSFFREPLLTYGHHDPVLYTTALMVFSVLVAIVQGRIAEPRLGALDLVMALFVLWQVISILLPHAYPGGDDWHFLLKGTILPLALYVAGRAAFHREESLRALLWTVAAFTVYSSIYAIGEIHGPSWLAWPKVEITESGWVGRAVGIFNQPVVNGIMLVLGAAVLVYLAQDPKMRRAAKVACYLAAALAVYAVQLTATRSALLSLGLVLVLGALFARTWRKPFVVALVLGVVAIAANWKTFVSSDRGAGGVASGYEIVDRLNINATALRAIGEHPLLGIGLGRFPLYNTDHHVSWSPELDWKRGLGLVSHENELGIAAELGLIGLALWLAVLVLILVALIRAFRGLPAEWMYGRRFAFLGVISLVVWLANSATVDMRFLDFANALPFLLMGVSVGLFERFEANPPPTGLPGGPSASERPAAVVGARPADRGRAPSGHRVPTPTAVPAREPVS